jgi:competence ComEA-like helix-hairpin-helix protein
MAERKNINEATREDIAELPFMSDTRAEMIVHYREVNGPYKQQRDLEKVTGINERLAARVAEYFEISEMPAAEEEDDRRSTKRARTSDEDIDKAIKEDEESDEDGDAGEDGDRGGGNRSGRKRAAASR